MTGGGPDRRIAAEAVDTCWSCDTVNTVHSGDAAATPSAGRLTTIKTADLILIFSLLKIRKKTSAVIAGILIGMACLWGIAMWQDIPPRQLLNLFIGSFAMLFGIMLLAIIVIVLFKGAARLISPTDDDHNDRSGS